MANASARRIPTIVTATRDLWPMPGDSVKVGVGACILLVMTSQKSLAYHDNSMFLEQTLMSVDKTQGCAEMAGASTLPGHLYVNVIMDLC